MNHSYLPKKRASVYIYNGAIESKLEKVKRLSSIVPLRGDPKKYNQKVTRAFVKVIPLFCVIIRNLNLINIVLERQIKGFNNMISRIFNFVITYI
jgi:hypothetical protein